MVPMVDQGQKGYCVVATAERVMRYYGVQTDEHESAELANTSAATGTSMDAMLASLKKLAARLRVRVSTIQEMDVRQLDHDLRVQPRRPAQAAVGDSRSSATCSM